MGCRSQVIKRKCNDGEAQNETLKILFDALFYPFFSAFSSESEEAGLSLPVPRLGPASLPQQCAMESGWLRKH
jgi:hypothetical protein